MKSATEKNILSFLEGGGEMGALIRTYDWAKTPVGSLAAWPVSLRTAVGLMLTSRFPMLLFWGSDLITFYNDAFRPGLGDNGKHPASLGQRGEESWAESWPTVGPLIRNVMAGGDPVRLEDQKRPLYRHGKTDYAYWTYSFSPVRTDEGNIGGLLVTCAETTKTVESLQALQENKERLRFALDAGRLGDWELDLQTMTLHASGHCKAVFGRPPDGPFSYEALRAGIHPDDRQRQEEAVRATITTGTDYDIEFRLVWPDGSLHWANVRGRLHRSEEGKPLSIAGVSLNITKQKQAGEALRAEKERFQNLLRDANFGVLVLGGGEMRVSIANEACGRLIGHSAASMLNRPLFDAVPEARDLFHPVIEKVQATGEPYFLNGAPYTVYDEGGRPADGFINVTFQPYREADGRVAGVMITVYNVTERVGAQKKIEETAKKLNTLIQSAPLAICLFIGRNLVIETPNETFIEVIGRGPGIAGKPLREVMPEPESQPFLRLLDDVFTGGKTFKMQGAKLLTQRDGKPLERYFDITFSPLFDERGAVTAVLNIGIDVTEQVRARQKLEESDLFTRSIIDHSPVAKIVFTGPDMVINTVNQNMLAILGRSDAILGKPFMEAVPELLPTPLMDRLRRVYTTGETFVQPEEKIALLKDGHPYTGYYQYIYKALRNTAGEIYGVICTATEITEGVKARKKIEEAEAVLAAAIELAELATWNIDLSTNRVTYSRRLQEWLGIKESVLEAEGSSRVHKRDQARIRTAILKATEPGGGNFDEVYTIVNQQSGEERIIHANGRTLYGADGKAALLSGTAQDVTVQQQQQLALERVVQTRTEELAAAVEELRATNEELAESNAQLLRSNEELAQYAYVASHDLQEPLRKIRFFSGRLNPREQTAADVQATIEKIQSSADRMSLLIKDLLEFSQLLKSDSLFRPVALDNVIKDVVADFELTVAEKEAEIKAGGLPVIEGVSMQLNQLFYNLVGNALKFTKAGRKPVIEVASHPATAEELTEHLEKIVAGVRYHFISVSDNGIGFEPKYLEQIFDVFKRLHGRNEYAGSGIGLAICRRIVQNHQGKIYAEARPGEGARFCLLLPEKQAAYRSALPENFVWKK